MPTIRIQISTSHVDAIAVIPMSHLGPLWGPFCAALSGAGGFFPGGRCDPQAPQERCADVCTALRRIGFTLKGSPAALELARRQGFKPSTPALAAPQQPSLPFPAAAGPCPFPAPALRAAQSDLERWAQAGLNVLMSTYGKGHGPSKMDRPGLTALYVKLCDSSGLTAAEWDRLCMRLRKYHKQIGDPP